MLISSFWLKRQSRKKAMKRNRPAVMAREISQASRRLRTRILQSLLIHLLGKIKPKKRN